jgi:hypothetical protein
MEKEKKAEEQTLDPELEYEIAMAHAEHKENMKAQGNTNEKS